MKHLSIAILLILLLGAITGCTSVDPISTIYVGSIHYTGDCWDELVTPANAMGTLMGEAPTQSNAQSGFVYLFADEPVAVDEKYVHFTLQMPHSYKEGTNLIPDVRFIFNSDQVGTSVRWKIAYSWANVGSLYPVATNIWKNSNLSNNDATIQQQTIFAPISGVGKKIDSNLLCYLSRNSSDASDNYTDTAIFVSVGLLYQLDSPGSLNQWSK